MGELSTQAQPVKLVADKLPRADTAGQVAHADLVGQSIERCGHLLVRGEAVGGAPAVTGGPQAVTRAVKGDGSIVSYDYDERGNMDGRYVGLTLVHNYVFDDENRLTSVTTNNQTTTFAYDADGQRVLTVREGTTSPGDEVFVYTPFPDYEVEVPVTGQTTTRTTYRIAGQMVAVQVKVGTAEGVFSYTYTDHLGNVVALSTTGGTLVSGSLARYDPFGNYGVGGLSPSPTRLPFVAFPSSSL